MIPKPRYFDTREFYRNVRSVTSDSIKEKTELFESNKKLLENLVDNTNIPIVGSRLWEKKGLHYELIYQASNGINQWPLGTKLSLDNAEIRDIINKGIGFFQDPFVANKFNGRISGNTAISTVQGKYLMTFDLSVENFNDQGDISVALELLRHLVDTRFKEENLERKINEANRVQRSVIPDKTPNFPGFSIHGFSLPAAGEKIGGDFYHYFEIDNKTLGIAIADATGHGLSAALMARDIHTSLHMGVFSHIKLTEMMQRINNLIHEISLPEKFISMFYAELSNSGNLVYSSAGHPSVLITNNEIRPLREGGPVLGIASDITYTRDALRMDSGDILCLYSDGIPEAIDYEGEFFGEERLFDSIIKNRDKDSRTIVKGVFNDLGNYTRLIDREDDQTIVIVKRE